MGIQHRAWVIMVIGYMCLDPVILKMIMAYFSVSNFSIAQIYYRIAVLDIYVYIKSFPAHCILRGDDQFFGKLFQKEMMAFNFQFETVWGFYFRN